MRIGMMTDIYKPHVSGVTNYISLNKQYLEELGNEVFIFTFKYEEYLDKETNVIRSPGLPLLDTGFYFNLRYSQEARRLLRMMDVVHIHHPFISGSLARAYCRPLGIPMVFTNHTRYDLYSHVYIPVMPDSVSLAVLQAYMPSFCRACDLVIAPSEGMREAMRRFGVDVDIDVVPNGVDLQPFQQITHPMDRSSLGFEANDVVLIYVGRLGPEKNLTFLMRSFAGTAQAYDHVKLLLIGDGPERDNLEDQVKRSKLEARVCFAGLVPYPDIPGYLAMADAFVTASVTEVHPLTVIEAMATGLPVLGIQSPGIGDTIQEGQTGFLAPQEDLAMFTAKMVKLAVDGDLRRKMGKKACQEAQNYAIEHTTQLMQQRYEAVVERSAGRKQGWRARFQRWLYTMRR
jgi:1,2-diacylglycerol 3-alpha-glucosyltransferase